jgi:hypothetical protein
VNETLDYLGAILEPDDQTDIVTSAAEPFDWEPNRLYTYLLPSLVHDPFETGPSVFERFAIRIIYVVDDQNEGGLRARSRDVSDALDARRTRYLDTLREKMSASPFWAFASAREIAPPQTLQTRAVSLQLTGYRIVTS